ncbi:hypothetical protein LguiA_002808 [Lonicera macranthoides]
MCLCCTMPRRESVGHVFGTNDVAKIVWNHFKQILHIQSYASILQLKPSDWWLVKVHSPCFKEILLYILVYIFWEV